VLTPEPVLRCCGGILVFKLRKAGKSDVDKTAAASRIRLAESAGKIELVSPLAALFLNTCPIKVSQ
jgi:hypothetical protein